jgi:RES domain-containing protein
VIGVHRVVKEKHTAHALDGEGSRLYGSRWTSPGLRVVHTSQSLSLAVLEILVHLQASLPLAHYVSFRLVLEVGAIDTLELDSLPDQWRRFPAPPELRHLGDAWLASARSLVLRVPSAVIEGEWNYLVNPTHPEFGKVEVEGPRRLDLDPRLVR